MTDEADDDAKGVYANSKDIFGEDDVEVGEVVMPAPTQTPLTRGDGDVIELHAPAKVEEIEAEKEEPSLLKIVDRPPQSQPAKVLS